MKEKGIQGIEKILKDYSLEIDDSGQDWIENEGFYYEYARRIYNAGYRNLNLFKAEVDKLTVIDEYDKWYEWFITMLNRKPDEAEKNAIRHLVEHTKKQLLEGLAPQEPE